MKKFPKFYYREICHKYTNGKKNNLFKTLIARPDLINNVGLSEKEYNYVIFLKNYLYTKIGVKMSNIIEQIEKSNIEASNKKLPPLVLAIVYLCS